MNASRDFPRVLWNAPPADGGSSITKYKIEWDPDETFGSGGDGGPLGSHQKVVTDSSLCSLSPCEYTVPSLSKGMPYHVRVFAYNQVSKPCPIVPHFSFLRLFVGGLPGPLVEPPFACCFMSHRHARGGCVD